MSEEQKVPEEYLKSEWLTFYHHPFDGEWIVIVDNKNNKQTAISESHLRQAIERLGLDWI